MSAAPPSPRPMPPSLPTPPKLQSRPRSDSPPPPQPIAVTMSIPSKQQQPKSNGTTSATTTTTTTLAEDASPSQLASMLSSSYDELEQKRSELSTAQSQLLSFSKRADAAERKLALLESALSIPVTYPHALAGLSQSVIQAERPDVLSHSEPVDSQLKQAALAVKECEIRAEKAQSLADSRARELARLRQDFDRVQSELTTLLTAPTKSPREREELSRAKDDLARSREELARTREVLERTREDLVSAREEVTRLASMKHDREREKQITQAWDEADSFLRLCEGRMAEARVLFSRIISQNSANTGWLPPVPVSSQQQPSNYHHHHPPPPPPPSGQSSGGNRIPSPLMPRTTAIVPSSTHAPPPPPPPPTIGYPRIPNQHARHRRDRSPGPPDSYPYEEDGERPSKRQRAISGADQRRYPPEEAYRSPPHHTPQNTVRQYNTYPDVSAHQSQSQSGQAPPPQPPPPHARHRSRSSSGSQSLDDFLLAAAETKSGQAPYHEQYHRPRERGDSGTSSNSGYQPSQPPPPPPQSLQAQPTQTHVFAPVQTGAPVKKGKSNASMGDVQSNPALAAPTQFYPATNEQGQRLCRQCGMTGRYKDNKCVEKWGPGPLGPGTVCDRCRKKMKRVERRGTLENSSHANMVLPATAPTAYNPPQPAPPAHHPPPPQSNLARTDTVVYPNPPPTHREQGLRPDRPVATSRPHSRPQSPPPTSLAPVPAPGPPPPPPAPAASTAAVTSGNPMPTVRRGPSPPPTIEVLPTSSATGSAAAGGEHEMMEVDDLDADADADGDEDGDEADIDGELLEAVDAAEKGSHHASD